VDRPFSFTRNSSIIHTFCAMLDIQRLREFPDSVKQGMLAKGESDPSVVDKAIEADESWRHAVAELDSKRAEANKQAKEIGQLMAQGKKEEAEAMIAKTGEAKEALKSLEEGISSLKEARDNLLLRIPNVPHESVPVGKTPEDNQPVHHHGDADTDPWRKPHWEIVEEHGWIDFKRGVKVTGAGFPFYVGPIAKLQRALIQYFLDTAADAGFTEIQPPFVVNEDSARGTGQIPDKEDMMYVVPRDEFFAIPTAEVPVTNFHRDEVLSTAELPIKYCAYTPCWRREAGSYGKEVRGLNRLHQFDKVELVYMVKPSDSYEALEELRSYVESLIEALGLSYRTLLMCTADMGFTQSKKYDMEVWSPGQQRWLEVSSCSNFEDFQARRMMIRAKDDDGSIELVHTLNGSGLALPRIVAAIVEQYQQPNGDILVPSVLQSYMRTDSLTTS